MNKRLVLLCLVLGACAGPGKRGDPQAVYDLGAPAARQTRATVPLALAVRAPRWFDSTAIQYRLAYAEPARLHDYAQARWAAPPAQLAEQRLRQRLGLQPSGQGGAKCQLRLDIDEFSQVFETPERSRGVLEARAVVLDSGRNLLAERRFTIGEAAASQDSRGGVAALTAAVERLADEVGDWQSGLAAGGRLKGCQPG